MTAPTSNLVDAGAARLTQQIRDVRDRFVASDPGRTRLRTGVRVFIAVASTVLVQWGLAGWVGRPALLAILLGAAVAMLMSASIKESRRSAIAKTAAGAPLMAAVGATMGVLTAQQHMLALVSFVAVSFLAVWMRRFGPRWFTLGFLFWQGFFFALFLHPPVSDLPFLLLCIAVSGTWVGLLLLTVLYVDPRVTLQRTVSALRARARAGISTALELLDAPANPRLHRQLRQQLVQLAEIALLLDGQLAERRALPDGVAPGRLRRWTVDVEIGMDRVCSAVRDLAAQRDTLSTAAMAEVRGVLLALGWGDQEAAAAAAHSLERNDDPSAPALRRLGSSAVFLLDTVGHWDSGELTTPRPAGAEDPDALDTEDTADDFEPAVTLVGGNLPGSAALAEQSNAVPDAGRWSPSKIRLTTRQAVQAAVAAGLSIVAGQAISEQRYYWAVIAAFVAFAGTATSGETLARGVSRIVGTLLGLLVSVWLANLTIGHPGVAIGSILVCISLAFFFQLISNSGMVFFFTVMLGQLYTLLGTFTDEVLVIRLEETVAGAVIGILVSLLVLPTHSRATLRVARVAFFTAVAELLDGAGATLAGRVPERDLITLAVLTDAAGRQVVQTSKATRGRLFGTQRVEMRHRVTVLGACGAASRALAAAVVDQQPNATLARACTELAAAARELAEVPTLQTAAPLEPGQPDPGEQVRRLLDQATSELGPTPAVRAARRLNDAFELLGPRSVTSRPNR